MPHSGTTRPSDTANRLPLNQPMLSCESRAQRIFTWARSNPPGVCRSSASPVFFENSLLHLHVPAGATPKDGPSAGVTMASALLSLARRRKPVRNIAMTGELTLTGQVLPVGGIREKVIAARRANIRELILPEANRGDFEEIPDYIREGVTVHFARQFTDVVPLLFDKK